MKQFLFWAPGPEVFGDISFDSFQLWSSELSQPSHCAFRTGDANTQTAHVSTQILHSECIAEFDLRIILHSWIVEENQHTGNIQCHEQHFYGLDPIMKAWLKLGVGYAAFFSEASSLMLQTLLDFLRP